MQFSATAGAVFALLALTASVAARCQLKSVVDDCCFKSYPACKNQVRLAEARLSLTLCDDPTSHLCAKEVTDKCKADCCTTGGKGIGCPR